MRYTRLASCVLLTLFLHTASNATTPSKSSSNAIRIWSVGSPHTNSLPPAVVPDELRQRAESLGYTIEIEAFRANGFAAKFREAVQSHTEPEILTFDNYGVISGVQTRSGWFAGVDSDGRVPLALVHETMTSIQPRGWVMLVRSAVNESGTWRLLAITHDPINTVLRISLTTTNTLVNSLDRERPAGITPERPRPLR